MADDYSVELQGHTFSVAAPRVTWDAVATHRFDSVPAVRAWWDYTIDLEGCRVRTTDGTTDKAQEALGTFATNVTHKTLGVLPTYLKILDSSAQPIDEIGLIQPGTNGWEELLVERWSIPPGEEQFKAGVEFSVRVTARKVFTDANGATFLRRRFTSEIGVDGLESKTLQTEVRMPNGTAVPITSSWLLTLAKQSQPNGWARPGGTRGFSIEYPRYGNLDEAILTSVIRQIGGSPTLPAGAGDGGQTESRVDVPELGLVRVTTTAFVEGVASATTGRTWVEGKAPTGSVAQIDLDKSKQRTVGTFTIYEASTLIAGKVYRVSVQREFVAGGGELVERVLTGNVLGPLRRGPVTRWRLTEEVTVSALGATKWTDLPTLTPLATPWELIPTSERDRPTIVERGGNASQHRWGRTTSREYFWDKPGDPRKDPGVRTLMLKTYDAGEPGLAGLMKP